MKNPTKYIITSSILAIIILGLIWYKRRKENPLGKIKRPPKIRIVYSKKMKDSERIKITQAKDVIAVLRSVWSSQIEIREEFVVLMLDKGNQVLGYQLLSKGGISGTIADVRLIYAVALEALASSIIIAHNHPSGNTQPSVADIRLTKQVKEAGQQLNISLLDHIIITKNNHYSLADNGQL